MRSRRSRVDGLIYPLNSPVREVMRLASSRLFESGSVEYLVNKWQGSGVPEAKGACWELTQPRPHFYFRLQEWS